MDYVAGEGDAYVVFAFLGGLFTITHLLYFELGFGFGAGMKQGCITRESKASYKVDTQLKLRVSAYP